MNATRNPQSMVLFSGCFNRISAASRMAAAKNNIINQNGGPGILQLQLRKCANHCTTCKSEAVSQASGADKSLPAIGEINPQTNVRKPSGTITPVSGTAARFTIGADNGVR